MVVFSRRFILDSVFLTSRLWVPSSIENSGVVVCVGISLLVSGAYLLRSKVSKLWKGDIEVNVE